MLEILRRLVSGKELSVSQLFNEQTFGRDFCRDIKSARKTVTIESPYLTERRTRYFLPFFKEITKCKVRIRINTRHPRYHSQAMRIQAEMAARILLASGVKIYTYDDLRHRKLAIIDNKILRKDSMNTLSYGRNREIMRKSNSSYLCREVIKFIKIYY